ncbi:MAG: methyltransferase type 12 [Ectothiorhodospiraceae bacterium]|nr:methyltransferase type 12 [Ectothiorhodospiraceae bacterium]
MVGASQRSSRDRAARGRLAFLQGFLRHPERVGSVVPSSRFLERRIVRSAGVRDARLVVELGPGVGGTTRALLAAMPAGARLLAIEIDERFVAMLRAIDDARLLVHHGSARDLVEVLALHRLPAPDAVVAGIPFSTMPPEDAERILAASWAALAPGGALVVYQFRGHVADLGRHFLGPARVELEVRNVPPMRVYRWRKVAGVSADLDQ